MAAKPEALAVCRAHAGSQGLSALREYAAAKIEDWRDELEGASPERCQRLQGMIAGVRDILGDIWMA